MESVFPYDGLLNQDAFGRVAWLDPSLPDAYKLSQALTESGWSVVSQDWKELNRWHPATDIDQLLLVGHGAPGQLHWQGEVVLDASYKEGFGTFAQTLRQLLPNGGDVLIGGCAVGSGLEGERLLNELDHLTGLQVWASDDQTGSGETGDWVLEKSSRSDKTLEISGINGWNHVLATLSNTTLSSNYTTSEELTIGANVLISGNITITAPSITVASPISGDGNATPDQITLKAKGTSIFFAGALNINANIAGGGINAINAEGLTVEVGSNVVLSTRQVNPGGNPASDNSIGNSGNITLKTITNTGAFPIPGLNISTQKPEIKLKTGSALYSQATSGWSPGDISLQINNQTYSVAFGVTVDDTKTSITLDGTTLVGNNINITSSNTVLNKTESYQAVSSNGFVNSFVLPLTGKVAKWAESLVLPASVGVSITPAELKITNSTITASKDININATSIADGSADIGTSVASSRNQTHKGNVSVAVGYGDSSSTVNLTGSDLDAPQGSVTIVSNATNPTSTTATVTGNKSDPSADTNDLDAWGLAVATSVTSTNSTITVDAQSSISASKQISINSKSTPTTNNTATSTIFLNGKSSTGVAVSFDNASSSVDVAGTLSAGNLASTPTTFQLTSINTDGSFNVSSGDFTNGTKVTYTVAQGQTNPFPTLVPGADYLLLRNNPNHQQGQSYFLQPSSVYLNNSTNSGNASEMPLDIQDQLQIKVSAANNNPGILQSFTVNKPLYFSSTSGVSSNSITIPNHGLIQGQALTWNPGPFTATGGGLQVGGSPINPSQQLYAIVQDVNTIKLAANQEAAAVKNSLTLGSPTLPNNITYTAGTTGLNTTTGIFTVNSHGLVNNQPLLYTVSSGNTAIGGLSNDTIYYTIVIDDNQFALASSSVNSSAWSATNPTQLTYSSVGSGTSTLNQAQDVNLFIAESLRPATQSLVITASNPSSSGVFTIANNGFTPGQYVTYTGSSLSGLTNGQGYFVSPINESDFTLCTNSEDATEGINSITVLGSSGSGSISFNYGKPTISFDPTQVINDNTSIITIANHSLETGDVVTYLYNQTFASQIQQPRYNSFDKNSVSLANSTITTTGSSLAQNQDVVYQAGYLGSPGTVISGLTNNTTYYVDILSNTEDGQQIIQLMNEANGTPISFNPNQDLSGFGQLQSLTSSESYKIGDANIKNLLSGNTYNVVKLTNDSFLLTSSSADLSQPLMLNTSPQSNYTFTVQSTTPDSASGVSIGSSVVASNKISATGANGSNPKIYNVLKNPALLTSLKLSTMKIFDAANTKSELSKNSKGESLSSTSSLVFGGALAVSYIDHQSTTDVGGTIATTGNLSVNSSINQTQVSNSSTSTGSGQYKDGDTKKDSSAISVSQILDFYTNHADTTIKPNARLTASGNISINSKVNYNTVYKTAGDPWKKLISGDIKQSLQKWVGLLFGGNLGLLSSYFNTTARTKNWGAYDANTNKYSNNTDFAYVGIYQQFNNISLTTISSGAVIDANGTSSGIKTGSEVVFNSLAATGIINLSIDVDNFIKVKQGKPLSEVFSPLGNRANNGVGASMAFQQNAHQAETIIQPGASLSAGTGGIAITATNTASPWIFAQAGGSSSNFGLTGSFPFVTQSIITTAQLAGYATTSTTGALTIAATTNGLRILGSGSMMWTNSVGIGIGATIYEEQQSTRALIGLASGSVTANAGTNSGTTITSKAVSTTTLTAPTVITAATLNHSSTNDAGLFSLALAGVLSTSGNNPDNPNQITRSWGLGISGSEAYTSVGAYTQLSIAAPTSGSIISIGGVSTLTNSQTAYYQSGSGSFLFSGGKQQPANPAAGGNGGLGLSLAFAQTLGNSAPGSGDTGIIADTSIAIPKFNSGTLAINSGGSHFTPAIGTGSIGLAGNAPFADQANVWAVDGAGSWSENSLKTSNTLTVGSSATPTTVTTSGGPASLTLQSAPTIWSLAGAAALVWNGRIAVAAGVSVAQNTIDQATKLNLSNATLQTTASGNSPINLSADASKVSIESLAFAGAFSATKTSSNAAQFDSYTTVALAGAGAGSYNTINNNTQLGLNASQLLSNGSAIGLTLKQQSAITADGGGAALSAAINSRPESQQPSLSGSVGASVSHNTITDASSSGLTITGSTVNASSNGASGAITIQTLLDASLNSVSIGGALAGAYSASGVSSGALAGAGSGSNSTLSLKQPVSISGSTLSGSTLTLQRSVKPTIGIISGGFAAALNWAKKGNGTLNGALSVGASVSLSTASLSAPLSISSSTLTASSGALNISTVATPDLAMLSMGGALSLSAGQQSLVNGALAGAGAGATTTYSGDLSATINQSTLSASGGPLSLTSTDQPSIISDAGGVAVGIALGGSYTGAVSVGASTAFNTVSLNDQHSITNSTLTSSGNLSVTVNSTNNGKTGVLKAVTLGGSAAVGATTNGQVALAASGAGANSANTFSPNLSVVLNSSTLTSGGNANLSGNWAGDLTAKSGAYALGFSWSSGSAAIGASIGASLASNTVGTIDGKAPSLGVSGSGLNNLTTSSGATVSGGFDATTTTQAIAGTVAIAASTGGFSLSGSGAGSQADTNITLPINANLSIGTLKGGVSLSTTDNNAISTVAGAGSLSVGAASSVGVAVSAVAALATSAVNNSLQAGLTSGGSGAGVDTTNQAVTISTSQSGVINTTAVAVAASIAGSGTTALGGSGAGSNASTSLSGSSSAALNGVGVNAGSGAVSLTATDSRSITSDSGGYTLAGAGSGSVSATVAIGAAISSVSLSNTVASVVNGGSVSAASLSLSTTSSGSISSLTAAGALAAAGASEVGVAASGAGCGATLASNRTLTAQVYGGSSLTIGSGGLTINNSDTTSISTDTVGISISIAGGYAAVAVPISATKTTLTLGTQYNTGIGKSSDSSSAINQLAITGATSITTNANPSISKAHVVAVGAGAAIGFGAAVGGAVSLVDITLGGAVASTLINARGSTGSFGINTTGSLTLAPQTNTVGGSVGLVGATFGASQVNLSRNTALSLSVTNSTLSFGGDVTLGLSDTFSANATVTPVSVGVGGGAFSGAGGGVALSETSSRSLSFSNSSLNATGNITVNLQRTLSQLQSQNNTVAVAAGAAGAVGIGGSNLQTTNSGTTSLSLSGSSLSAGGSLSVNSSYASPDQEINGTVVAASVGYYSVSVTGSYSTLTDTSNTNLELQQSSLLAGGSLTATSLTTGKATTQVLAVSASLGIGAGLGANLATSTFSPTTALGISNGSYLQSGGAMTLSSQLNPASSGALSATGALASAVQSGGGVFSGQYSSSTATTAAATSLSSDSSSTVTAAGNLSLTVGGSDVALTSSPNNVSVGLLGYGGVSSTATTGSTFNLSPGGTVSSTGGSLTLNGSVQTASGGTANAVGVAGVSTVTNLASITNNTALTIAPSSSANLSGAAGLNVTGAITSGTLAKVDAVSAGLLGVGVTTANATDNSGLNVGAGGNLTSSGGGINLSATRNSLNQSISAFSSTAAQTFAYNTYPGTQALSTASGGGLVGVNAASATTQDTSSTKLIAGSGANLIAKQGDINLSTTGSTTSGSSATGVTVGLLVSVGVNSASTTTNSSWMSLVDGVGSLQAGNNITINATPITNISSTASASGGGLVGSNNIYATATATPSVNVGMLSDSTDTSSEAISAGGSYSQQSTLTSNNLTSSTSGTTGGAIAWTVSNATSTWEPTVSSMLPANAALQASGAITISGATADSSNSGFSAEAEGNAYGAGSDAGINSNLTVSPNVRAGVGNNASAMSSKGSASISANSQNKAPGSGDFMAFSNSQVGGIIVGATTNATGTYNPSVAASLGTNVQLQAPTGITITSSSNDNLSVGSSAGQAGLGGGFGGKSSINSTSASVTSSIGSGSTLQALQGAVNLQSNPGYNLQTSATNKTTSGFFGGQTQATTNAAITSSVGVAANTTLNAVSVLIGTGLNTATGSNGAAVSSYASYDASWPAIANGNAYATNNLNHQGQVNLSGTINAQTVTVGASMNAGNGGALNSSATGYGTIGGMTIGAGAYGHGTNNSTLQSSLNFNNGAIINAENVTFNSQIGNGGYSKSGQGMWKTNVVCGIPIYGYVNNTDGSFTANGTSNFNGTINAGAIAILEASESSNNPSIPTVSTQGPITYQVTSLGGVNTLVVNDIPAAGATWPGTTVTLSNGSNSQSVTSTGRGSNTELSTFFTNAPYWGGSTPSSVQFSVGIYDSSQQLIAANNPAYDAVSSFKVNNQDVSVNGQATTISLSPGQQVPIDVVFNANTLQSNGQNLVLQVTPTGQTVNAVNAANSTTLVLPSPYQTTTATADNSTRFTALGFQQQLQLNATGVTSGKIAIPNPGSSLASANNWQLLGTAPLTLSTQPQPASSQNVLIQQTTLPAGVQGTYYPVFTAPQGNTITSFSVAPGSAGVLSSPQAGGSASQVQFAFSPTQNGSYDLSLVNGDSANVSSWTVQSSANLSSTTGQPATELSYSFTTPAVGGSYTFTPVNSGTTGLTALTISGGSLTPNTALSPSGAAAVTLAANTTYSLTATAAANLTPASVLVNWAAPGQNLNVTGNSGQTLYAGTTYTYTLSGSNLLNSSNGTPTINILWDTSQGVPTNLTTTTPSAGSPPTAVTLGSSTSTTATSYLFKITANQSLSSSTSAISWYQPSSAIYQGQYTWNGTGTPPLTYTAPEQSATVFASGTNYSFIYNGDNTVSIGQATTSGGFTPWTVSQTGSASGGSYGWFTSVSQQGSSGSPTSIWANGVLTGFQAYVGSDFNTPFSSSSFSGSTAVMTSALNSNLLTIQVPASQTYSNPQNLQLFLDSFTPSSTLPAGTTLTGPTSPALVTAPVAPTGFNPVPTTSSVTITQAPSGNISGPTQGGGTNEVVFTYTPTSSGTYLIGVNNTGSTALTSFTYTPSGGSATTLTTTGANTITLTGGTQYTFLASAASGANIQGNIALQWYGQQNLYSFTPPANGTYYTGYTGVLPTGSNFTVSQGGTTTNLSANGSTGVTLSASLPPATYALISANPISSASPAWYLPQVNWNATSTYSTAQPSPANDGLNRYFIGLDSTSQQVFSALSSGNQSLATNGSVSLAMTSGTSYPITALGQYGTSLSASTNPSLIWHLQSFASFAESPPVPASLALKSKSAPEQITTKPQITGTSVLKGNGAVKAVEGLGYVSISNSSQAQLQIGGIDTQTGSTNFTATVGTSTIPVPSSFTGNGANISFATQSPSSTPLVLISNTTTNTTFTGAINAANGTVTISNPAGSQTWNSTASSSSGALTLSSYGTINLQQSSVATITGVNGSSVTLSNSIGSTITQPLMLGYPNDAGNAGQDTGLSSGALYFGTSGSTSVTLTPVGGQGASATPDATDVGLQLYAGAQLLASNSANVSSGQGINIMGAARLQGSTALNLNLAPTSLQPNTNAAIVPTGTSSVIDGWLSSNNAIAITGSNPSTTTPSFVGADNLSLGRLLSSNSINAQLQGGIDSVVLGVLPYSSSTHGLSRWINGAITLGALNSSTAASYAGPSSTNGWEYNTLLINDGLNGTASNGAINSSWLSGLGMGTSAAISYNLSGTTSAGFTNQSVLLGSGSNSVNFSGNLAYTSTAITSAGGNDTVTLTNWNNSQGASLTVDTGGGNDTVTVSAALTNNATYSNAIPNIILGDGDDIIQPNASSSIAINLYINAGAGNDTITGSINDDIIDGGSGNNTIDALDGNDTIRAGDGDNLVTLGLGNKGVSLGNGNNNVRNSTTTSTSQTFIQTVNTGWGDDIVDLSASAVTSTISVGAGTNYAKVSNQNNNAIISSLGSTYAQGGSGSDTYALGPGDVTLITSGGQDQITTSAGTQRIDLNSSPITGNINLQLRPGYSELVGGLPTAQLNITGSGRSLINLTNNATNSQNLTLGVGSAQVNFINTIAGTPVNLLSINTGTVSLTENSQVNVTSTSPNARVVTIPSNQATSSNAALLTSSIWKPGVSLWQRLSSLFGISFS